MSGLLEDSYIFLSTSLWNVMCLVEVYKKHLASHRYVVGERRAILIVFSDNGGYSAFIPYQNLNVVVPKVNCYVEYGMISMNFSFSLILKSIFLSLWMDRSSGPDASPHPP